MRRIDRFRMRMEKAKAIYTEELVKFSKRYDFLCDFTIVEDPDIDTPDYLYYFNSMNGTSDETLDSACDEIYDHMVKFSQNNGIDDFRESIHFI